MRVAAVPAVRHRDIQPPHLGTHEAVAVLHELKHRAERRLLDACQEFQDIAFEMEWRLRDWQALSEQRRWLEKDLARTKSVKARFNVDARKRTGKTPRAAAWQRHQKMLQRKLQQLEKQLLVASQTIAARNHEGGELEQEIVVLQLRRERIAKGLKQVQRPRAVSRDNDAIAAAMARLIIELSTEPDVGDLANLLIAARVVDDRLRD